MPHRVAAFLVGCWILGSLFMMFVAAENFRTADRMLNSPEMQQTIQTLGRDQARSLLRDLVGQENQLFFSSWEIAQLILGIALAGFLAFGGSRLLVSLAGALIVLAAIQHFLVTPRMIAIIADSAASSGDFAKLHAAYGMIEVVKLLVAVWIVVVVLRGPSARSPRELPVEAVKYAR